MAIKVDRDGFKAGGGSDADFDRYDKNGDGVLDKDELEAMAAAQQRAGEDNGKVQMQLDMEREKDKQAAIRQQSSMLMLKRAMAKWLKDAIRLHLLDWKSNTHHHMIELAAALQRSLVGTKGVGTISQILKRWRCSELARIVLGWRSRMGQGRAMDQVASQHTGAMMDALAAAKKQGGVGVMKHIMGAWAKAQKVRLIQNMKLNKAGDGAEGAAQALHNGKVQMQLDMAQEKTSRQLYDSSLQC